MAVVDESDSTWTLKRENPGYFEEREKTPEPDVCVVSSVGFSFTCSLKEPNKKRRGVGVLL